MLSLTDKPTTTHEEAPVIESESWHNELLDGFPPADKILLSRLLRLEAIDSPTLSRCLCHCYVHVKRCSLSASAAKCNHMISRPFCIDGRVNISSERLWTGCACIYVCYTCCAFLLSRCRSLVEFWLTQFAAKIDCQRFRTERVS